MANKENRGLALTSLLVICLLLSSWACSGPIPEIGSAESMELSVLSSAPDFADMEIAHALREIEATASGANIDVSGGIEGYLAIVES